MMICKFVCMLLMICMLAVHVSASSTDEGDVSGGSVAGSAAAVSDQEAAETMVSVQEDNSVVALAIADGEFAGGYYFVCDCTFGNDIKFYIPVEWAHDVFTVDSSGALVNLSNSTCYAYCPDYPNYTFYCSRFGTFVYRISGSSVYDLAITEITDSNMSLFDSNSIYLSGTDLLLFVAGLIFVVAGLIIVRRR